MVNDMKEVDYYAHCLICKHKDKSEDETPCDECLETPVNLHSHKPVHFEEKDFN